jgi:hypothetical protein
VTFIEPYAAEQFLKTHPGTLKNVFPDRPVRLYATTIMIAKGNYPLKGLLDAMLSEAINSGKMDDLIVKYDTNPGTVYPLQYPYRTPNGSAGP